MAERWLLCQTSMILTHEGQDHRGRYYGAITRDEMPLLPGNNLLKRLLCDMMPERLARAG